MNNRFPILSMAMCIISFFSGCGGQWQPKEIKFPDGKEYVTLIDADTDPELLEKEGDIVVEYKIDTPLEDEVRLCLVIVFQTRSQTRTLYRPVGKLQPNTIRVGIENPMNEYPTTPMNEYPTTTYDLIRLKGRIFLYLMDQRNPATIEGERVSNILTGKVSMENIIPSLYIGYIESYRLNGGSSRHPTN